MRISSWCEVFPKYPSDVLSVLEGVVMSNMLYMNKYNDTEKIKEQLIKKYKKKKGQRFCGYVELIEQYPDVAEEMIVHWIGKH